MVLDQTFIAIILFLVWLVFTFLAFAIRDGFLFGLAGIVAILFGLDLCILSIGDVNNWAFSVLGVIFFFVGLWSLIAAYQTQLEAD